jgi:hypothetical protein
MGVFKVIWGLLVDDARLAIGLAITLLVAYLFSHFHLHLLGAIVIWAGLVVSLWISVEHQLAVKLKK